MEEGDVMELAELAVKKTLSLGASEAEAYLKRARTTRVEFAEEIENFKTIESIGMTLRVALGKKTATYSTSILDKDEIAEVTAKAVKIAKVAPEDPHWKHLNQRFGKAPAEGYYDPKLANLDYQEVVKTLNSAINQMKNYDKRVRPTRGSLTTSTSNTSIANSYNETCEREETNIGIIMSTKAEENKMESTGSEYEHARSWAAIAFEDLALKAAEKAIKFLSAKPIPSGKITVIFRNQIFANILGVILSGPMNADWVQKGRSPLSDKLGKEIASKNVNLVDDGLIRGGWQTRPFDDEGHQTQKTPVIKDGILKSFLYDTYTALKDNVESTGNAQRPSYWMNPQPSPSNLILKPGKTSPEEIIQETRKGIYIEETIGEWLSNPVSGNLNATVTHGYLIENGELAKPVKGVVISGSFYEILKDGIAIIGSDLRNSGQNYSPTVKLAQLTIAGK
ncbi:MAG: TldD/PmbA family protein [Candidatus Bathyarchaeota archaeon]|nr:MAG: TldD/PmbA family protein [Candidatus Bathyarchaeota archaeon]